MDILSQMIEAMDRHSVRNFKIFASRNAPEDNDRKDFKYFDYIRQHNANADEEKIFKKLYAGEDKNAFYRLKNRLINDLSFSIFMHEHDNNEIMTCFYYAAMGYYYTSINRFKVALHFFKKAESKAITIEHYGMLDIVYSQLIKLARESITINPETYIKKRKDNRALLNRLSEVEDVLEALEYRMKVTQNISNPTSHIPKLLEQTLDEYSKDEELKNSPKVQFGIYFIISRTLLQSKDYNSLQEYLVNTYNSFNEKRLFNKTNHQHKLQMLAWIANAAFFNRNHSLSLEYAELLHSEMEQFEKLLYAQFEFFYYNAQVINFSAINPPKAIALLEELQKKKFAEKSDYYGVFIYLNLSILYFMVKDNKKAILSLNKLYGHSGYEALDLAVRLHINMGELMIRHELKEFEFIEYRLKQIYKEFKDELAQENLAKEREFLKFIGRIIDAPAVFDKKSFRTDAKKYAEQYKAEWEKEELLFRYTDWLLEKAG